MPVLYHSHSPKPQVEKRFGAQYRSLKDLLQQADFVCLINRRSPPKPSS